MPLQTGTRAYSSGSMIGGNYWAHPNGTGPSQTGTDTNHDGFIDTPFDLFGNSSIGTVYDYLPYSSGYASNLTIPHRQYPNFSCKPNILQAVTVQYTDFFGNLTTGTIVNLSSNLLVSGKFYSDAAGTQQITSLTIPAGSSTATFFYKDLSAGNLSHHCISSGRN